MNVPLCGTNVTGEILEQAFVAAGKVTPGSLESVTAEKIEDSGGHTSDLLRVFLIWKEPGLAANRPGRVLVKVPKQEYLDKLAEEFQPKVAEKMNEAIKADRLIRVESAAYRLLSKRAPEIPIPKCYIECINGENSIKFLAIEDLSPRARTTGLMDSLTKGQLINCAETLAVLQAWSLNTQYEWKKELPDAKVFLDTFEAFLSSIGTDLENSVKKYSTHLKCVDMEKVCSTLGNKDKVIAEFMEYRKVIPDVFVHGDFWASNILFEADSKTNSTSDRIAGIIDWQMSHQGSFAEDLSRLYSFNVDPEVRRSTMREVFRRYFDKMQMLAPRTMNSVSFDRAYGVFERAISYYALMMVTFSKQFIEALAYGNPSTEAVLLNRITGNYKDAAKFFNF